MRVEGLGRPRTEPFVRPEDVADAEEKHFAGITSGRKFLSIHILLPERLHPGIFIKKRGPNAARASRFADLYYIEGSS